ncbi:uncharacterized protein LOC135342521 isoform X2 [Halichondria panicea]|uniref:uncharacterized protein LOC135342521 isoform X2 n=1 Tax=Halichondria panicea TaxID=6063 RepID=UPI00312B7948
MDTQDIPDSAIRAVSKKLRHYIDVQRREEGFDSSSPTNLMGNFSSTKGTAGTFHYNSLQDRHLKHYYQQPLVRRQLVEAGVIHPGMLRDMRRRERSRSAGQQQRHSAKMESDVLLTTAARLLLSKLLLTWG